MALQLHLRNCYGSTRGNTICTTRKVFHDGRRMLGMLQHIHSPLVFENVQTYCTCDRADVGMPDLCDKPHLTD